MFFMIFSIYNFLLFLKQMFLIITKRRFFSFYNIFFYTRQAFVFHLLRDFYNVQDHIAAFFSFCSLERF